MSDFFDSLEADLNGVDLTSSSSEILPLKDYILKVKDWEFGKSKTKQTPQVSLTCEVIVPCDGEDVKKLAGRTVYITLYFTEKTAARAFASLSIMANETLTPQTLRAAKLGNNMFKIVQNKHEEYDGVVRFKHGWINALSAPDYTIIKSFAPDSAGSAPKGQANVKEDDLVF